MYKFESNGSNRSSRARFRFVFATGEDRYPEVDDDLFALSSLRFDLNTVFVPSYHRVDEEEKTRVASFDPLDYQCVAVRVSSSKVDDILLCHNGSLLPAYVIAASGLIKEAIYEPFGLVEDGKEYTYSDLLLLFGDEQTAKQPESFAPTKQGKVANLGYFTPSPSEDDEEYEEPAEKVEVPSYFAASSKKSFKNTFSKRITSQKQEEEAEEDDSPAPKVEVVRPSFVPSSSKKPKAIRDPKGDRLSPATREPDETPKPFDIKKVKQAFSPYSKKAVPNLNANPNYRPPKQARGMCFAQYDFRPNPRKPILSHLSQLVGPYRDEYVLSMATKALSRISEARFYNNAIFSPVPETDDKIYSLLKPFEADKWVPLVALTDQNKSQVGAMLLCLGEDPSLVINLCPDRKTGIIFAYSDHGCTVEGQFSSATFFDLYSRSQRSPEAVEEKPKPKPKREEPKSEPEETQNKDEIDEAISDYIDQEKEERRVFASAYFLKSAKQLYSDHPEAEQEITELIHRLLTYSEPALNQMLSSRNNKEIKQTGKVRKFRLNGSQYKAARVFYRRGYDFSSTGEFSDRFYCASDFFLLDICPPSRHDQQGEFAELLLSRLNTDNLYERMLLKRGNSKEIDSIAYPSKRQFALVKSLVSLPPLAFIGSAGTGKTLLSIENCLCLQGEGRTLYLTYEPSLRDYAADKLQEMGHGDVVCHTFISLSTAELGEHELSFEEDFLSFFSTYLSRYRKSEKTFAALSADKEEQGRIAYLYIRGYLFGSDSNAVKRMKKADFCAYLTSEEGYPLDVAEAVYDLGEDYQREIRRLGKLTDNDLASLLLQKKRKSLSFDSIIIDEYQDLTPLQFLSLLDYLPDSKLIPLYLYGDENQSVNPTIFSLSKANQLLYSHFGRPISIDTHRLSGSYRTGPSLLGFINGMKAIKRDRIGAQKAILDEPETSFRLDADDLFVSYLDIGSDLCPLVSLAFKSNEDFVFLFPSSESCERAKEAVKGKLEGIGDYADTSFLPIEQAKGREWDGVILVDFLTEFGPEFAECLSGEQKKGRHVTSLRMMFNRLYVGLTRAKNRILITESNAPKGSFDKLLSSLQKFRLEDVRSIFSNSIDPERWKSHGKILLHGGDYEGARRAFVRALPDPEAKSLLSKAEFYIDNMAKLGRHESGDWQSRFIDFLIQEKDYRNLERAYLDLGLNAKLDFLSQVRADDRKAALSSFRKIVEKSTFHEKTFFFTLLSYSYMRDIIGKDKMLKKEEKEDGKR